MKFSPGIDLVDIERVQQALERHGERFLNRVFTATEQADCAGRVESLAARYAAKEAAAKALGTGLRGFGFTDIEVIRSANGAPLLRLRGPALALAQSQGWHSFSVSLTHTPTQAAAFVILASE